LDIETLCDALRRLPPEELQVAFSRKLVPLVSLPGLKLHVACGIPALEEATAHSLKVIAFTDASDLIAAARAVCGPKLLQEATLGLARRSPEFSASRRLTDAQAWIAALLLLLMVAAAVFLPLSAIWIAASALSGAFFLSVIALRLLCLFPALKLKRKKPAPLADRNLPVYSVLVPLFRETSVLKQLLEALGNLDYPALCIKRTKTV
jgi:hypothetical protein